MVEDAEVRMSRHPGMMRTRRATVEHPFGTLKAWTGLAQFLTKALRHVSTEMSLRVLSMFIGCIFALIRHMRNTTFHITWSL